MANSKMQPITVKLTVEDYGWLIRYSEKNDITASQVVRKALHMYRLATNNSKKKKTQEVSENG